MRNLFTALVCVVLLVSPCAALAQEKNSSLFVGPAFSRNLTYHHNALGWNAQYAGYATRNFGLVVSSSGMYSKFLGLVDLSTHSFFAGPQFRFPSSGGITPFVRVVSGVALSTAGFLDTSASINAGGVGAGGGVDIRISPYVAVRAVQFDYWYLRAEGAGQGGISFSTGIVFQF